MSAQGRAFVATGRLPDFLIIGAQKAGTTWLGKRLASHPDIFLAHGELHYFDKEDRFARGKAWYASHFADARPDQTIGEKTPDYYMADWEGAEGHLPDVHRNIHDTVPEARLILLLRDPVARAVSAAKHLVRTHRVSPLVSLDDLLVGKKRHLADPHGVIAYGHYARQIDRFTDLFGRDRLHIMTFEEDVVADPAAGLASACRFLGVDDGFQFPRLKQRVNRFRRSRARMIVDHYVAPLRPLTGPLDRMFPEDARRPTDVTLAALRELYAESDADLARFLGRPVPWPASADESTAA